MAIARCLGLAAAGTVLMHSAMAQENYDLRWKDATERCAQAPSPALRINCLEDALALAYGLSTKANAAPGEHVTADAMISTELPSPSSTTKRAGDRGRSTYASDAAANPETASRMGAEQVAARDGRGTAKEDVRMLARVERVVVVPYRRLQLELENGQVWRQIRGDSQRIDPPNANDLTVDIWESRMGGYQMQLHELGRTIRVERLQ